LQFAAIIRDLDLALTPDFQQGPSVAIWQLLPLVQRQLDAAFVELEAHGHGDVGQARFQLRLEAE
jgi:DNA-binding helix-hairpin-helix protein with protein kinase domain